MTKNCDVCNQTLTTKDQIVSYSDTVGNTVFTHVDCVRLVVGNSTREGSEKGVGQKTSFIDVIASNADTIKAEILDCEQRLQVLSKEMTALKARASLLRGLLPEGQEVVSKALGYRA